MGLWKLILLRCLPAFAFCGSLSAFEPDGTAVATKPGTSSYLGIGVAEVDADRAKTLNLPEVYGVEVTHIEDGGPASKAGLQVGDVVLEYNKQRVEGVAQFVRLVRETPAGREVQLSLSRAGSPQTVTLKTGARKVATARFGQGELPRFEIPDFRMPDIPKPYMTWRSAVVGVEVESLDSQLAQYFGVKEGALVRSVLKGSAAERAGLKAGDVIVKVEDTKVTSARDISNAVRAARSKKNVSMLVVRDRQEVTVLVPLDDTPGAMSPRPIR